MPRRRPPKYRQYNPKNLAVVRIDGKDRYLGTYESPQSWRKYLDLVQQWYAREQTGAPARRPEPPTTVTSKQHACISIDQLILAFVEHARGYYVHADGSPTQEVSDIIYSLNPLRRLFGGTAVGEFGPKRLKVVRQFMIDEHDWSRKMINQRVGRIKRMFRWGVEEEMVDPQSVMGQ